MKNLSSVRKMSDFSDSIEYPSFLHLHSIIAVFLFVEYGLSFTSRQICAAHLCFKRCVWVGGALNV